MSDTPLVSVVILSWNRIDDLRFTLETLRGDSHPRLEVIVVDNASTDGTPDMVRAEFPSVRLIELPENIGIAGWNAGFEVARGRYILVLDDDSYPEAGAVAAGVEYMEAHPRCGVAGFRVYNEPLQIEETRVFQTGPELMFTGCGAMIRRSVIGKVGMFDEFIFLYEHEVEFSMRVWNAGFRVDYVPGATVHHRASQKNRGIRRNKDCRRVYYTARNTMYVFLKHYSMRNILFRAFRVFAGRLLGGILAGCGRKVAGGLLSGIYHGVRVRHSKRLLQEEIQQWYGCGMYTGGFFFDDPAYRLRRPKLLSGIRFSPSSRNIPSEPS